MKEVEFNPFRMIGVLSTAKEKDIHRQKVKIGKFTSVGKELLSPYDFSFLKQIVRTEKSIDEASSKIEQRIDKLTSSLFWLADCNQFDELAFKHLKDGALDKAINTWLKVTENRTVTDRNISCLNNLSTIQLVDDDIDEVRKGIANKLQIVCSSHFNSFVHAVTDNSFNVENRKLAEQIIDVFILRLLSSNKSELEVLYYFGFCEGWVKEYVGINLSESHLFRIEKLIETTKKSRTHNATDGFDLAMTLYKNACVSRGLVKNLIGDQHIKYQTMSDSVAKEIIQCDIENYNAWHKTRDTEDQSLKLLGYAKEFSCSEKTRHQIKKDIEDMSERKEKKRVAKYYDTVYEELEAFRNRSVSIDAAVSLLSRCRPKLASLKSAVGNTQEYINTSSVVVSVVLGAIIDEFNGVQNRNANISVVKTVFSRAAVAVQTLSNLDMNQETRTRFDKNRAVINQMNQQAQNRNEGCYIATMAYGDYDHPQVLELRKFRDDVLKETKIGRQFIATYYKYSPKLVERLKGYEMINQLIKFALDKFIIIVGKL